jgi:hypothetical protein
VRIGGIGGVPWDGSIVVDPEDLSRAAPGFAGAGDQVATVSASSLFPFTNPADIGITAEPAASAWARLATVWSDALQSLAASLHGLADHVATASAAYVATDRGVMPVETIRRTTISEG